MHSGGLVHLDLSTENVMLDSLESLIPKVIDFGTTGCIPTLPGFPMGPGFVGKKQYAAPEVDTFPYTKHL
jgi:serine/threonine protein kinase